jgi:hypothetical protein
MIEGLPLAPGAVLKQVQKTDCQSILIVRSDANGDVFIHTSEQPELAIALADAAFRMLAVLLPHEPNLSEH